MTIAGKEFDRENTDSFTGWLIALVFLICFLLSPNLNTPNGDTLGWIKYLYDYSSDSVNMRFTGIDAPDDTTTIGTLFNPHHLLYLPVTGAVYNLFQKIFPAIDAGSFLRVWNSFTSAAILYVLYVTFVGIFKDRVSVSAWIIFTGASVTFFLYATDGSQYMTALFFLVLALSAIADFFRTGRSSNLVQGGSGLAIAVLFHQIVAIMVPFILLGTYLAIRSLAKELQNPGWKPFVWMAVYSILIPLIVYLLVALFILGPAGQFNLSGIFKYATLYAHNASYWNTNIFRGIVSTFNASIGLFFGSERTDLLLFRTIWFTALTLIVPLTWILGIKAISWTIGPARAWMILTLSFFIPTWLFLCFWNPGHVFYHLFLLPAFLSLSILGVSNALAQSRKRIPSVVIFWLWIFIATLVNLPYSLEGSVWRQSGWLY